MTLFGDKGFNELNQIDLYRHHVPALQPCIRQQIINQRIHLVRGTGHVVQEFLSL